MTQIRAFRSRDSAALVALWREVFGATWPLPPARAERLLTEGEPGTSRELLLAWEGQRPVGFTIVDHDPQQAAGERSGDLAALGVVPDARRRGIGALLHKAALATLAGRGVRTVQLGGGAPRFWPGVPTSLPDALAFFAAQGWEYSEQSHDMTQPLADYVTPPAVYRRAAAEAVEVSLATPERLAELFVFVEREFPEWAPDYRRIAGLGDTNDLLLAIDQHGRIVGALVLYTPRSHPSRSDVLWTTLLGERCGALGVVGVADAAQRRGIGSLLVGRGTELLRERGATNCLIGWTWALEFYGRLGYRLWRTYQMSWRTLP
jgi:GNAT superfamily N-acetyltransferase